MRLGCAHPPQLNSAPTPIPRRIFDDLLISRHLDLRAALIEHLSLDHSMNNDTVMTSVWFNY
ncbi:hypothetical protein HanPSC8_Chr13g0592471 [Helianthus annuus]|nr:hypothetical protein HanPSC8_Chr13g0592471 [Helianthus annuus]